MSTIAPVYGNAFNTTSRNALVPAAVIDEPVIEHEHHHVHHHIDHGSLNNMSVARGSDLRYVTINGHL